MATTGAMCTNEPACLLTDAGTRASKVAETRACRRRSVGTHVSKEVGTKTSSKEGRAYVPKNPSPEFLSYSPKQPLARTSRRTGVRTRRTERVPRRRLYRSSSPELSRPRILKTVFGWGGWAGGAAGGAGGGAGGGAADGVASGVQHARNALARRHGPAWDALRPGGLARPGVPGAAQRRRAGRAAPHSALATRLRARAELLQRGGGLNIIRTHMRGGQGRAGRSAGLWPRRTSPHPSRERNARHTI
eukprot:9477617-Pyramimonas_sp.AAC.1